MNHRDNHIEQLKEKVEQVQKTVWSIPDFDRESTEMLSGGEPLDVELNTIIGELKEICTKFGKIHLTGEINTHVCDSLDELYTMVGMHERLIYPFLRPDITWDHSLFDGSIYTIIQVLKDSADKIRATLAMKPWEKTNELDGTYQAFVQTLSLFTDKILKYMDVHDRYIYPIAIEREETFDL